MPWQLSLKYFQHAEYLFTDVDKHSSLTTLKSVIESNDKRKEYVVNVFVRPWTYKKPKKAF